MPVVNRKEATQGVNVWIQIKLAATNDCVTTVTPSNFPPANNTQGSPKPLSIGISWNHEMRRNRENKTFTGLLSANYEYISLSHSVLGHQTMPLLQGLRSTLVSPGECCYLIESHAFATEGTAYMDCSHLRIIYIIAVYGRNRIVD